MKMSIYPLLKQAIFFNVLQNDLSSGFRCQLFCRKYFSAFFPLYPIKTHTKKLPILLAARVCTQVLNFTLMYVPISIYNFAKTKHNHIGLLKIKVL